MELMMGNTLLPTPHPTCEEKNGFCFYFCQEKQCKFVSAANTFNTGTYN